MGANIAQGKCTTESSSVIPFTAAQAVNGNLTSPLSRWVCTQLPGWMMIDLGEPYWINRAIVRFMETVGWDHRYNNKDFSIEGSQDGNNWFMPHINFENNLAGQVSLDLQTTQVRYVRLKVSPNWGLEINPSVASVVEFEVYEADNNPYLRSLTISKGTLNPAFNKKTFNYRAEVDSTVNAVDVTPTADASSGSTIKVNNNTVASGHASTINLSADKTTVTIAVTNGVTQNYIVEVMKRPSAPVTLSDLVLKGPRGRINLIPAFTPDTQSYTATANSADVTVTPSTVSGGEIRVNGTVVMNGGTYGPINLSIGSNRISITVTPPSGGTPTEYVINVTRNS